MDEIVLRAQAKWPAVPDVYGWLVLDRRGRWLLRNPTRETHEPIGNSALRQFIARNYSCDAHGQWFFQNGPQRVFVRLAYTPFVLRARGETFLDQCGLTFESGGAMLDEEGSLLLHGNGRIALLDDRDLAGYAEAHSEAIERLPRIESREVSRRFGFIPDPTP
ncbi:MAG: DUF2946 family protein [Burkholderiales bacterium]